jgi:hypothetical protein
MKSGWHFHWHKGNWPKGYSPLVQWDLRSAYLYPYIRIWRLAFRRGPDAIEILSGWTEKEDQYERV